MATGHVMMAMSLDGFVARPDRSLDWLMKQDTTGEDHGFEVFLASVDAIVMGSGSFRTVLEFDNWPYDRPVFVMSESLRDSDIPPKLRDTVELSILDPRAIMNDLHDRGFRRIYVDGGAVIRSFLKAGLITDMKVTLIPILIGDGIRMFGDLDRDIDLTLEDVKEFASGLVDLRYRLI